MIDLASFYREAIQKRTTLEPAEWCERHVRLFRSTDASTYRREFTPWWSEPMREIRDNDNKVISIMTPVGSGKSTLIEAMTCNILDGDPGPMLISGQTNEDVRDWAETGLWPTLADSPARREHLGTPVEEYSMGDSGRVLALQEGPLARPPHAPA